MFPLTLPELRTSSWSDDVEPSFFQRVLAGQTPDLLPSVSIDPRGPSKLAAWAHYSKVGGYPALTNPELTEDDRHLWLAGYVQTYLERDVRDLASFRDLEPFVRLQQWTALRTATVLNASAAAVEVGVSTKTVQKYLQYLELSYQALLVPAWHRNLTKRLTRAAKVHWLDHGVLQAVLRKRGGLSGPEFESLVVSELFKQTRNLGIRAPFFHLRTQDGLEVDLLIELPSGYLAFEMKSGVRVDAGDARHLRRLGEFLDKPVLGAWVVSQDPVTRDLGGGVSGVHVTALLG